MLFTELHLNQSFKIDGSKITMIKNKCNKVRLSIEASPDVLIEFEKKDSTHTNKGKSQI